MDTVLREIKEEARRSTFLSRKPDEPALAVVRPVLEELLMHAGYLNAPACAAVITAHLQLDAAPTPALA